MGISKRKRDVYEIGTGSLTAITTVYQWWWQLLNELNWQKVSLMRVEKAEFTNHILAGMVLGLQKMIKDFQANLFYSGITHEY